MMPSAGPGKARRFAYRAANAFCRFLAIAAFALALHPSHAQVMRLDRSLVGFTSDAQLERIEASTTHATGALDASARTFAVRIPIATFEGFNSPLQREHFNENYMDSEAIPDAQFKGRVIEAVDLSQAGTVKVRAKGVLSIHGVDQERIIACELIVSEDGVRVTSEFNVVLSDHDIRVPGIVRQKIAPAVKVRIDLLFRSATP